MSTLTFAGLRSHHIFHGGDMHPRWCTRIIGCDGQCTTTASWPTLDGRTFTITVTLPHNALWPTFTCTLDGLPAAFDPHLHTVAVSDVIYWQVRVWCEQVPSPVRRAAPAGGVR
ncbi:hypothetical protein [Micromonospora sp. NBC_00421]|uniref:hypothetical protein n=1 Tax=Micromonospora sp. NBC_00421 TaxID=2975976 RepID=UPI002E1DAA5D